MVVASAAAMVAASAVAMVASFADPADTAAAAVDEPLLLVQASIVNVVLRTDFLALK